MKTQKNIKTLLISRYMWHMMGNATDSELIRFYGVLEDKNGILAHLIGDRLIFSKRPFETTKDVWSLKVTKF